MRSSNECTCEAVTLSPDASCIDAAEEMDAAGVGCVVVVDAENRPLGIVTDRDLTRRVVAADRDPEKTKASDVMSEDLVLGAEGDSIEGLLERMRERKVRRMPLVREGRLVGLISLDDLVMELSSQLYNVSEGVWVGLRDARRSSRARRRHEAHSDALEDLRERLAHAGDHARQAAAQKLEDMLAKLGPRA